MTTQTRLTCTCGSRYVRDAEHEGDCDLWLIDEFWAGFLAWDWDAEALRPTPKNPDYFKSPLDQEYEWVEDYLTQKDAKEKAPNGQAVEDVMLTTDAFIDRMLAKGTLDTGEAWIKQADGMWVQTTPNPATKSTSTTYSPTPKDYDDYDWGSAFMSDRHAQTQVPLPDGETSVYCTSLSKASECEVVPDFALYMDMGWRPDGLAIMLPWRDYGMPQVSDEFADYAIKEAFAWAKSGAFVELGCIGAHGRTGVVLACMAALADPLMTGPECVAFVRTAYCHHAIETKEQEWWVARFVAVQKGEPIPAKPVYVAPKPTVVTASPKANATQSPSAGPIGDPNRKGKARRSKRGGKRQQRHRSRAGRR